jgi:hypothetical protein
LFHSDGHKERQTYMTNLILAIRNFANASKNAELILDSPVWFLSVLLSELTLKRLMSYIYMEHPFLMFLDHTQRRSTVGRTPLDE